MWVSVWVWWFQVLTLFWFLSSWEIAFQSWEWHCAYMSPNRQPELSWEVLELLCLMDFWISRHLRSLPKGGMKADRRTQCHQEVTGEIQKGRFRGASRENVFTRSPGWSCWIQMSAELHGGGTISPLVGGWGTDQNASCFHFPSHDSG